jgi:uncharacterized protein YqgV (UPF0045/DUF77 family)
MDIGVEISLYPLREAYIPTIQSFIDRLNADGRVQSGDLRVVTNSMSTQIFGSYDAVFGLLQREMQSTFAQVQDEDGKAIFVMKFLGPLQPAGA